MGVGKLKIVQISSQSQTLKPTYLKAHQFFLLPHLHLFTIFHPQMYPSFCHHHFLYCLHYFYSQPRKNSSKSCLAFLGPQILYILLLEKSLQSSILCANLVPEFQVLLMFDLIYQDIFLIEHPISGPSLFQLFSQLPLRDIFLTDQTDHIPTRC